MTTFLALVITAGASADPVSLLDDGGYWHVSNGRISLSIEQARNYVTSLRLDDGPELLTESGAYLDINFSSGDVEGQYSRFGHHIPAVAEVIRESPDLVELRIRTNIEARDLANAFHIPLDIAIHYVVRRDDPAVAIYVVFHHPPDLPAFSLGQTRMAFRPDPSLFTHYFVSDAMTGTFPKMPPGEKPERVTDATSRFPDGRIATKYNLTEYEDSHRVHGMTGGRSGLWVVTPSSEYVNGGPTKQNLTVHEDDVIMLRMFHAGHFLGEGSSLEIDGEWSKVYGPFLLYANAADSPQAMWQDAKSRADAEAQKWPYQWVDEPAYALPRGSVAGRAPFPDARLILAEPVVDWQVAGRGYVFSAHAADDGAFTIRDVSPGAYTLYGFAPGVLGEFRLDDVVVSADRATDLGDLDWQPLSRGEALWEIGTPDRSAGEFRYGDQPRQFGLWNRYREDFPEGVEFRIGESEARADWNYCQPALQHPDGEWRLPEWEVLFDLPDAPAGEPTLTIAIAGATGGARLVARMNDAEIHREVFPHDSCVTRDAVEAGRYRLLTIPFPASLLTTGANTLSLKIENGLPKPGPFNPLALPAKAIMYDYLRLEIAR